MSSAPPPAAPDLAARALAWTRGVRERKCDLSMSWEYGTVLRASRYPAYYQLNVVRVEGTPEPRVDELLAFADRALQPLAHRLIFFESELAGAPLRSGFEAAGFHTTVLVWMHHEGSRELGAGGQVSEVEYEVAEPLRRAWHEEDFSEPGSEDFPAQRREVALAVGTRTLAMMQAGEPAGFASLEPLGDGIEVDSVYVRAADRGRGYGTTLTRAAIAAAGDVRDLWICADAEDRPQHLYARLGFRPVMRTIEFLRI